MPFSVASNLTLLTHEHFVHRDYTKFPTIKASFVYLHSWKQWRANVLQSNEVSYFKGVQHHNATTNRSPPWMIPALMFYRHVLENLGLSGKACLSRCVLIPWQHSVTVLSRGSASHVDYHPSEGQNSSQPPHMHLFFFLKQTSGVKMGSLVQDNIFLEVFPHKWLMKETSVRRFQKSVTDRQAQTGCRLVDNTVCQHKPGWEIWSNITINTQMCYYNKDLFVTHCAARLVITK